MTKTNESVYDSNSELDSSLSSNSEGCRSKRKKPSRFCFHLGKGIVHGAWVVHSDNEDGVLKFVKIMEWHSIFLTSISHIDITDGNALAKYVSHCFEGNLGKRFHEVLYNSVAFTRFNKYVATELIQTNVLATNSEFIAECSSYSVGKGQRANLC